MLLRIFCLMMVLLGAPAFAADTGIPAVSVSTGPDGAASYSVTLQILILMTMLTFLPAIVMMMTSFTRIMIVFAILRQALGLQQTPSNQILIGLTLFLTLFVMGPVLDKVYVQAVTPYVNEELNVLQAIEAASGPFREFMLYQTRGERS